MKFGKTGVLGLCLLGVAVLILAILTPSILSNKQDPVNQGAPYRYPALADVRQGSCRKRTGRADCQPDRRADCRSACRRRGSGANRSTAGPFRQQQDRSQNLRRHGSACARPPPGAAKSKPAIAKRILPQRRMPSSGRLPSATRPAGPLTARKDFSARERSPA